MKPIKHDTRRVRIVRNRHGSAKAAVEKWLAGSLWGDPIWLGQHKCHVYGAYRRKWTPVGVEFTDERILVVRGGAS